MSKNPPMTPENLTQRFKECMDRGMRPPFVLCMVSPNGSHTVLRVGEQGMQPLGSGHTEPAGWELPATILILDQNNQMACFQVAKDDKPSQ